MYMILIHMVCIFQFELYFIILFISFQTIDNDVIKYNCITVQIFKELQNLCLKNTIKFFFWPLGSFLSLRVGIGKPLIPQFLPETVLLLHLSFLVMPFQQWEKRMNECVHLVPPHRAAGSSLRKLEGQQQNSVILLDMLYMFLDIFEKNFICVLYLHFYFTSVLLPCLFCFMASFMNSYTVIIFIHTQCC